MVVKNINLHYNKELDMKKIIAVSILIISSTFVFGASKTAKERLEELEEKVGILQLQATELSALKADNEGLKREVKELVNKVVNLENLVMELTAGENVRQADGSGSPKTATETVEGSALVTLESWRYSLEERDYSNCYRIAYELKNKYPKGIKLIDAGIRFTDLLDERLMSIEVDRDLNIPGGQVASDTGLYRINQFSNEQARTASMDKEDIKATLYVSKIVFEDNTILEF
jgi:hypothetical protein